MLIQIKNEVIKHMADAKVDDLQGIITIASVVARVTETKEELSDEAKVL